MLRCLLFIHPRAPNGASAIKCCYAAAGSGTGAEESGLRAPVVSKKRETNSQTGAPGRFGLEVVWSKYSNGQRVSSLHLSKGCLNLASRSDTYFFRVRSSLPAARPAADLSQPCAPPVGLSPATLSPGVGSQSCGAKYPGFFADSKGV